MDLTPYRRTPRAPCGRGAGSDGPHHSTRALAGLGLWGGLMPVILMVMANAASSLPADKAKFTWEVFFPKVVDRFVLAYNEVRSHVPLSLPRQDVTAAGHARAHAAQCRRARDLAHARARTRARARTHARTHKRTHAHTHTRTHAHTPAHTLRTPTVPASTFGPLFWATFGPRPRAHAARAHSAGELVISRGGHSYIVCPSRVSSTASRRRGKYWTAAMPNLRCPRCAIDGLDRAKPLRRQCSSSHLHNQ